MLTVKCQRPSLSFFPPAATPPRPSFQLAEYDRVVFSSACQRLQHKTQVMSLSEIGHTRLAHPPETACMGRPLSRRMLRHPPAISQELPDFVQDCGDIVASARLAHNIGNPPFGHSGEEAVSAYFASRTAERFIIDYYPGRN